ncbi:hypothetical protein Tco_0078056 [Tanacetum coccineum]
MLQNYNHKTSGGLLRDLVPIWTPSSKKSKSTEAPKSDVPADSQQPSVEVSSQKATIEDVEVPSNPASTTQHTGSSFKKVGTRKKRLGRKGVHPSHSTIPIEDGDPEAEHKMCLKYASDADSASDDDTPVNLHAVVDWELLPTGLGWINVIYRKDNSRKCFTSLREILHLVTRADLMTIYGRVMTFYQDKQAAGVGLVLWGDLKVLMDSPEVNDGSDVWKNQHTWNIQSWKLYSYSGVHVLETVGGLVVHMFVDKKYPLSVNLIERMLDHQLEICQETVGNELTTAVQLIAFLKKQISDSRRPKVHDCPQLDDDCLVADSKFLKVAFGVDFKILLFNPLVFSTKDLSRNLKLTVYVVPTGKDNVIVSAGRTKVIPAGTDVVRQRRLNRDQIQDFSRRVRAIGSKSGRIKTLQQGRKLTFALCNKAILVVLYRLTIRVMLVFPLIAANHYISIFIRGWWIGRKAIRRGEFIRFLSNFIFGKKDMIYTGAQTGDYEVLMWSVSVKPNEFTILYEMCTSSRLVLFLLVRLRLAISLYPSQLRKLLLERSLTSMAFLTSKMVGTELGWEDFDCEFTLIYLLIMKTDWMSKVFVVNQYFVHGMMEKYQLGLGDERWPFVTHSVGYSYGDFHVQR